MIIKIPDEFKQFPQLKGIFVGGCVDRGEGSSFRAQAHAHTSKTDKNYHWICVRSAKRLYMSDGRPSRLLWHELAHIITDHGHDDKWRAEMKRLGQPLPKQYIKKVKGVFERR